MLSDFLRFIPAGAGNTREYHRKRVPDSVYPRWRGEHHPSIDGLITEHGLSPLARGTLHLPRLSESVDRFIPAGAGNTVQRRPTV